MKVLLVRGVVALAALALVCNVLLALLYAYDTSPGSDAAMRGFPLDDAYIHLVYARAIADHGELAYNPGQLETGETSPLWALLLSPLFLLKQAGMELPTIESVKVVGVLCATVQALLAGLLARRLADSLLAGVLGVLLTSLDPGLSFARVSGMEVPLAGALLVGALWALVTRRAFLSAALLGLGPLARPELALGLLLLPVALRSEGDEPRRRLLARAGLTLTALTPSALWVAVCLHTSGRPLPSTFYAKHRADSLLSQFEDLPATLSALLADLPMLALGLGLVPLTLGTLRIAREPALSRPLFAHAFAGLPFVLGLGLVWAHALTQPLAFYWYRYIMLAVPVLAVWVAVGAADLLERTRTMVPRSRLASRAGLGVLGAVIAGLTLVALPSRAELYAWNCQNITEAQVTIGRWAAANVPPDRSLATVDAGAIRYYSHRRTVDLLGLNSHAVLEQGPEAVVRKERPFVFVVFPDLFPRFMQSPALEPVFETRSPRYTICECDQAHMVVLGARRAAH